MMKSSEAARLPFVYSIALMLACITTVSGFGFSCNFRCRQLPTLLDYMRPIGCYCHSGCGGKLRCCGDKSRYCGSSGGGGSQACDLPRKVYNAKVVGGEKLHYRIGETITYECDFRYEIVGGTGSRKCIGNNVWSPGPPRCKFNLFMCRPPTIYNGDYFDKKKQYRSTETVRIQCNSGYILDGSSTMRCQSMSWTTRPQCIKDRCASTKCSKDATCENRMFYSTCVCNEGFEGSGSRPICKRKPCYKHTCNSNEICVDSGDGSGDYVCECKIGYERVGDNCRVDPCFNNNCHQNALCESLPAGNYSCECGNGFMGNGTFCAVDPCFQNDCHENATCVPVPEGNYDCMCKDEFVGNGTFCKARQCDPTAIHGVEMELPCAHCEEDCCNGSKIRECRVCIHTKCRGGEVCGESSRMPTVCTEKQCFQNTEDGNGNTVDAPSNVHCLDDKGLRKESDHCCWFGE